MSSNNVQLRGGPNNYFADIGELGHVQIKSSFEQIITPPDVAIPAIPNTPVQLQNIPCVYVVVENPSTNDLLRVGTVDTPPYIDRNFAGDSSGSVVYPGSSHVFEVNNANLLLVVGATPGQYFGYHCYPDTQALTDIDTTAPPDTTPPTVLSTSPVNGATSVSTSPTITITFSKAMDPDSVIAGVDILASPSFTFVPSFNVTNTILSLAPSAALSTTTTYTITVKSTLLGVLDANGYPMTADYVFSFTTGAAPDTTAPTVTSTVPAASATGIAIDVHPTILFSEAMKASTITTSNIQLLISATPQSISVSLSADNLTVTITPAANLSNNTTYTIRVNTGTQDLAGNAIAAQFNANFTTVALVPPTVSSTVPTSGATGVSTGATVTIVFSQQMKSSTINTTNIKLIRTSDSIEFTSTVSLGGDLKTVTLTPSSALVNGTQYTIKVTTGVQNTNSVALASQFTSNFTVVAASYTQVYNVTETGTNSLNAGSEIIEGEIVHDTGSALFNVTLKKVIVRLKKAGSPPGNLEVGIYDCNNGGSGDAILKKSFGTMSASALSTSTASYTFVADDNTVALAFYYGVCVRYNAGDASNHISVGRTTADAFDTDKTCRAHIGTATNFESTDRDLGGTFYT